MTMIRPVTAADAAAICAIYNHYVLHTTANFEEQTIPPELMAAHIAAYELPWLVLEEAGQVLAYAYAGPCPAYRGAADTSIYVAPGATGRGLGPAIYRQLLDLLRARGLHSVLAGIVLPNRASVALHERLGFRKVGHFEEVGWKRDAWLDVGYWQLKLS
jgi:phosphinothricin acetyltransferase